MSEKILTISVAAYNLEKLIKKNLESFLKSPARNQIEVIVTDDESKDNTAKIVHEYEEKYPGIVKLVKQKNQGPGSSVNNGIKYATGKYFKMVDGDDWVVTENLKQIIEILKENDADMVLTNYLVFSNATQKVIKENKFDLPNNCILNFNEYCSNLDLEMHSIMYKTSILKENKINVDNCFYTDSEYIIFPSKHIKNFMYINLDLYVYLVSRAGQSVSIESMKKNVKMHELVLKHLIEYYENCKKEKIDKNILEYISNKVATIATHQFITYLTFDNKKERKEKIVHFDLYLEKESKDIFKKYRKRKIVKYITNSNYLLLNLLSKIYIMKIKREGY